MDIPIKKKQKKVSEQPVETYDIFDLKPSQKQKPQNQQTKAKQLKQEKEDIKLKNYLQEDGEYIFDLNSRKKVRVSLYKQDIYINIREYFQKDGESIPTKKGISLSLENWNKLKQFTDEIDECIQKLK